jgi:hypothetical protein
MYDKTEKYWFNKNDEVHIQRRKKQRFIRNQKTVLDFYTEMYDRRKSYQVLYITLNVKKKYRDDVSFRTMQGWRDRLFRRIKYARDYAYECKLKDKPIKEHNRTILHDIQGLIWRQEYGDNGGSHHLHLIVFVSVSRRDHVQACEDLGLKWEDMTPWGDFHNGNRHTYSYKNKWGVAVGYMHRDDEDKQEALRKVIELYMCKTIQEPEERSDDHKLFGVRYF